MIVVVIIDNVGAYAICYLIKKKRLKCDVNSSVFRLTTWLKSMITEQNLLLPFIATGVLE